MTHPSFLNVCEIFASIQGEGASAGQRAGFLRLARCNLACRWCDTAYSWDFTRYSYESEVKRLSLTEVAESLAALEVPRLVVTGGEPLLQQRPLGTLVELLPRSLVIEVETNGTLEPLPALLERVDQWNVSPKLANSGEPRSRRLRRRALEVLATTGRAWLKLVIEDASDLDEASHLVLSLGWPKERVLLMPQASTKELLKIRSPGVAEAAAASGYGVSPRLHVERWGARRGV